VTFTPARRVNQALTASLQKRALQWMAGRAPRGLSSDQLTVRGLCSQGMFGPTEIRILLIVGKMALLHVFDGVWVQSAAFRSGGHDRSAGDVRDCDRGERAAYGSVVSGGAASVSVLLRD
jgi:hypothetical protein